MSGDEIVHEVSYSHPVERVWRALTDRDALAMWLMPNDFEPRVGHRFTFRVGPQEGWSGVVECEVVALDAPSRVAYTWRSGADLPQTLVTFTLTPLPDGTRLRLVHSGFAAGGERGFTLRDLLSSGWGSRHLRETLPALLDGWAAANTPHTGKGVS